MKRSVVIHNVSGKIYTVYNITAFAKQFNLKKYGISRIINKHQKTYKGWRLVSNKELKRIYKGT